MDELLAILKTLEKAIPIFLSIGPEVGGLLIAPPMATHVSNFLKLCRREYRKAKGGAKWHWLIWHMVTWSLAFIFSFVCFALKYDNVIALAIICTVLASCNSAIVEYWCRRAEKNAAADAFMRKVLILDKEDLTMMTRATAFAAGVSVKTEERTKADIVRETWTPERRARELAATEITTPRDK